MILHYVIISDKENHNNIMKRMIYSSLSSNMISLIKERKENKKRQIDKLCRNYHEKKILSDILQRDSYSSLSININLGVNKREK